ncbi:Scarecrow-like protein 14 [Dichanthelium oligosanthes]|uniref:Scarecrow-like protein 14 n=1 Tax=Dichanthelium oligosanthes TaxID=888268 RepID=A0A1E5VZD1_9POAL|nr:Scarecrow-like protein 14 [Dichanthelium oligosanthes]
MAMDPGSRNDIDFGDVFSTSNPPTGHMINFSLQQQSQVQFFPSYGLHSHNPPVSSHPSPSQVMLGCTTPSPASTTTTELDNSEEIHETVTDDTVLAYINQFLLEDEDDEYFPVTSVPVEGSALLAVEKPFVDILKSTKPAQAYEGKSWTTGHCDSTEMGGLDDVVRSTQKSCQLPCETVKEDSVCAAHKGRKNPYEDGLEMEERKSKQSALCEEETVREMFDKVLLCTDEKCVFRSPLPIDAQISSGYVKGSGNRRGRRKGRSGGGPEEETVDLTTLLIHCAQAAAIDDHRNSNELLKQIRKHSSATGDACQRLAHYFANGLEARLAGTGSSIYRSLAAKRTSTGDILKAFHLYVKACPFSLISYYVANSTILNASKSATKLHIIDYGIKYGFQYPVLMQRLSNRHGGPPSLRITGIDFPQPGFRPAERIEATGRRLHELKNST